MPLTNGTRLGPYEIVFAIGAGGMGEVYKARDTRLDRDVAIKVLPPGLAGDPQLRDRFEREAKAISSLNHPHICTLFDVGHQDPSTSSGQAVDFLVLEYLEGETIAERLARSGALDPGAALKIAIDICDALDKAHRSGIVHRDLKPANVMLTKAGAKLLPREKRCAGHHDNLGVDAADHAAEPDGAGRHPRDLSIHGARTNRRARG